MKKHIFKVFDMYAYAQDGTLLFIDENLESASLAQSAEQSTINNGKDNAKWSTLNHSKELKLTADSNVLDIDKFIAIAGNSVISGATKMHCDAVVLTPVADAITLPKTPLVSTSVQILDVETDKIIEPANYTIVGTTLTFGAGHIPTGDVKVIPYEYTQATGAEEVVISAKGFPSAFKVVLKTVAIDETDTITHDVEIEIPKMMPSANFELTTSSNHTDGMSNSIELDALKDSKSNYAYIRFLERP